MNKNKKIGIVLKGYPRLSETFISQEILSLQRMGFDFHIISLRHPTDKAIHPVNKEITAPVTYLPEYVHEEPLRVLRSWLKVRRKPGYKKARKLFFQDLKRDFTRNRFRRFAQGLVIAAEFGEHLTALYAHFLHTPTSATRYGAAIYDLPFAISAHAKDIWTSPDWEITEKLDDCEWLATCTRGASDHLKKLSPDPDKVNLIYHGLDLKRFPPPAKQHSEHTGKSVDDRVEIISVGRAVAKKGFDNLLDALALLPDDFHWHWKHIGGGELRNDLMAQASRLGLEHKCEFCGAMDQTDVIKAYQESEMFVLPCRIDSSGDRDGLPNVIVEAQSQELAVISSPISGIPELIEDGKNGILIEPDQPELLSEAILKMANDPDLRQKMGEYGANRVRTEFDHLTTIGDLAELLHELIANGQKK